MDAAGAALLDPESDKSEKRDGNSERSFRASRGAEEWEVSQMAKRRRARLRTITATIIIPVLTLTLVFSRFSPFHRFESPHANTTKDDSILQPHLDPVYHLNPHLPNSPLNHIHRRDHRPYERAASESTASSIVLTGTALQTESPTKTVSNSASQTVVTAQGVPTVPSTPPNLPTPFPQPFDSDLGQNFSTQSCFDFLVNMTNTQPFRSCRPFGMLVDGSTGFADASRSPSTLNAVVWGTCNTNIPYADCIDNVDWFSDNLQTSCAQELSERNTRVMNVLAALQSYPLYHKLGCLIDPASNTYCYVNAVQNTNPADVYLYGLGLGTHFPQVGQANPTCSACSRQILAIYAGAAGNGTGVDKLLLGNMALEDLQDTYPPAAKIWANSCGSTFAQTTISASNDGVGSRVTIFRLGLSILSAGAVIFWTLGTS